MNKIRNIYKYFTKHPTEVGETYFEHFTCASGMAKETIKISGIMMFHAIFPFVYQEDAGERINKLSRKIIKRQEKLLKYLKEEGNE